MTISRKSMLGALAAVFVAAGCSSQPKPIIPEIPAAEQGSETVDPQAVPGRNVDQMEASVGTIEALTAKSQNYTREMSPLVEARVPAKAATTPQSTPTPSMVEWIDPAGLRLGDPRREGSYDPNNNASSNQAMVRQVINTAPAAANSGQAEAPAASGNDAPHAMQAAAVQPPRDSVAVAVPAPGEISLDRNSAKPPLTGDALADRLSHRVKDYPRDVSGHLEYQLLQFLRDETTPQLPALSSLPPEDRELVTTVLDGLTNFRNALRADHNMLLSRKIKPLMDMSERLRSQADLTVPTIALCKSVTTFGVYEPFDPPRFPAGMDQQVIVYCEVANFLSSVNDKQMWETRLTWDMTLYAEGGLSVWSDKTETISDASRNRRHDFFVRKAITLPKTLPIGRYLLKVTIVDTQSNRVSEATAPLVIAVK